VSFPRLRLPASGWKRWLALLGLSAGILILLLVLLVSGAVVALQSPSVQRWIFEKSLAWDSPTAAELNSEPAAKPSYHGPVGEGSSLSSATEIYRPDRFWNVGLFFSGPEWSAIQHQRVTPVENWMSSTDGSVKLRNPQALRNGLAGVLGLDLPWSTGRVSLGGVVFTNTAVRFKGNGSYLGAMRSYRKPFKLHLSKYQKGQHWAGRSQFSLGNLSADLTCLSDTLGYEFFREAGVPAPRTAFARVFLNIEGVETNRIGFADQSSCIPDWYTPLLATSESVEAERTDDLEAFLAATSRGYQAAMEDPSAAADALLGANDDLDPDLVRASAEFLSTRYAADPSAWGRQRADVWERFTVFLRDAGILGGDVDVEDAWTNQHLPAP